MHAKLPSEPEPAVPLGQLAPLDGPAGRLRYAADDDSDDVYEVVDETSAPPQLPPKPPPKPGQSNLYVYIRFIFFL